jgi:hypothetical protein
MQARGGAFKVIRYSRKKSAFTLKKKIPSPSRQLARANQHIYCMWSILPSESDATTVLVEEVQVQYREINAWISRASDDGVTPSARFCS